MRQDQERLVDNSMNNVTRKTETPAYRSLLIDIYEDRVKPKLPSEKWGLHRCHLPEKTLLFSQVENQGGNEQEVPKYDKQVCKCKLCNLN